MPWLLKKRRILQILSSLYFLRAVPKFPPVWQPLDYRLRAETIRNCFCHGGFAETRGEHKNSLPEILERRPPPP